MERDTDMPTSAVMNWSGQKLEPYQDPQDARLQAVQIVPAGAGATTTLAKGTVLGQVTATGKFTAYSNAAVNGAETARMILAYDIIVNDAGAITFSTTAGQVGGEFGETYNSVPAYYSGTFRTNDLTGLDAAAVTELGALVSGSVTDGILRIG